MRRLPVYLLLDISGSMSGEPIQAVNNGIQILHSALRREPQAHEIAYLSVITFESSVKQLIPLTELNDFQPPSLKAGGGTSLGGALDLVTKCAEREVIKNSPDSKGDYKPLVYIMTDGEPTDNPDKYLPAFKAYKWGVVVACAAGSGANTAMLQKIAGENVLALDVCDSSSIAAYFKYVSSSIVVSSKRVDAGGEPGSVSELPPPPPEISLIKF
ncbi:MAG: VWA domain-containing protein [Deltaproteobacteria bacterium]|jgi:uncharacterized protein YegL|nr:VWA domain-containing protein [Deltaproteobacteria bacterium]